MKKTTKQLKYNFLSLFLLACLMSYGQSMATYTITFTGTWNATDHSQGGTAFPSNDHWSDLVGATHNSSITFWESGQMASTGIENIAETGSNTAFFNEVDTAIDSGNADQWLQKAVDPFDALGSATLTTVTVSEDFPLLSLVSMIAPSPDWMIAVDGINLRDGNAWVNELIIPLFAYDSGTDSGMSYTAPNQATTPNFEPISILINEGPFNAKPIGTLTITFNETLNVDVQNITEVSLYPNPSKGDMTIKTPNSNILDQAQVYDILGKQVANFKNSTSNNELQMDLTHLNNGIYLVRLILIDGSQSTKKVVIN